MRLARVAVLSALTLLLGAGAAAGTPEEDTTREQSVRRSVEILAHIDHRRTDKSWLAHHLDRIGIDKTGLVYSRPLAFGERDLQLQVQGPRLDNKSFGLSFEIRF